MKRFMMLFSFLVALALPIFSSVRSEATPVISINLGRPYRTVYYPEPVYVRERPVYIAHNHCHDWDCDDWRWRRWHRHDHDHPHHGHGHDHGRGNGDWDR